MVCTYKLFTDERVRRNQTGERAPILCTALIFTCTGIQCFIPPVVVHKSNHHTKYLHHNIPIDWIVYNSPSIYMDYDGCHKFMAHFPSMCCSSPLNSQVLFYDGHGRNIDDREFDILHRQHIQYFTLNSGDYVHYQPNNNDPNTKFNILYGNARMNCMEHHGNLKFTPSCMNSVLVETWEAFKISSTTITQKDFKNTHLLPLYPHDIRKNHQA